MKLIIAGSTGFVATEVIRQALSNTAITSIIGLARRATTLPQNTSTTDTTKFKSVICNDFGNYLDDVKRELFGADACIWLIAITPSQLNKLPFQETRKICLDYTVTGLETISSLSSSHESSTGTGRPFRFIYVSGAKSERDQSKKPWPLGEYSLMRGEVESHVLEYAKESNGRQGLILKVLSTVGRSIIGLPIIDLSEIAATLLEQAVNGIEKDTLSNEDLRRIGQKVLASN